MIKKTLTFPDLDGKNVTKAFWFHLMPSEAIEIETSFKDGMEAHVLDIARREDKHAMILFFKDLIAKAYGERDADDITFNKSDELSRRFTQTNAYSVLFFDLLGDAKHAIAFVKGVMPAEIAGKMPDTLPVESLQAAVDSYVEPAEPLTPEQEGHMTPSEKAALDEPHADPASPDVVMQEDDPRPLYIRENRKATQQEMQAMDKDEMLAAYSWAEHLARQ